MKKAKKKIYNISKKFGDKIGLDVPYFVENGFWVLLNQGFTIVFAFLLSIIFARYLEKETYGQYHLVISILSIVSIVSLTGLNIAISRAIAQGYFFNYRKDIRTSFKWSLLGMPVLAGVALWFLIYDNQVVAYSLFFSILFFPFIYSFNKWKSCLKGLAKFETLAKYNIIQTAVTTGSLIVAAVFFREHLLIITGIYLVLYAGFNTFWHLRNLKSLNRVSEEKKYDTGTLPYGKFLTKLNVLTLIVNHFDKILIGFLDIQLLAVYIIAIKLIDMVKSLVKSFYSISFPKFAKSSISIKTSKILMIMFIGLLASVLLYYIAEPVINFLYTVRYSDSVGFFKKLIFILPFTFVNPLFNQKIRAQKKKRKILMVGIHVPLISIILSGLVFIIFKDIELFILVKVYTQSIALFFVLMPWFIRE